MSSTVKKQLAQTMNLDEKQIMDYKKQEDGTYTVILFNFQKFTGVTPAEPAPVKKTRKPATRSSQTSKRTAAAKHSTKKAG